MVYKLYSVHPNNIRGKMQETDIITIAWLGWKTNEKTPPNMRAVLWWMVSALFNERIKSHHGRKSGGGGGGGVVSQHDLEGVGLNIKMSPTILGLYDY